MTSVPRLIMFYLAVAAASALPGQEPRLRNTLDCRDASRVENKYFVASVAFSPDGKMLAAGGLESIYTADKPYRPRGTIKLWDLGSGKVANVLKGHADTVLCTVFSPDGKTLASGDGNEIINLWDVSNGKIGVVIIGDGRTLAFSPDGKTLASGGGQDNTVRLWDLDARINRISISDEMVQDVAHYLKETGADVLPHAVVVAPPMPDASGPPPSLTLKSPVGSVWSVAFSPDGKTLASGNGDKTITLWETNCHRNRLTLRGHSQVVHSVAFSPDGKMLASASHDGTAKLWDLLNGKNFATLNGHTLPVLSVAFSHDGRIIASGSVDESINLWVVGTWKKIATLTGHKGDICSLAFSPDGKTLASGSWDGTVRLWEVNSTIKK